MSRFFIVNPLKGEQTEIDFGSLISIIHGTSIISIADSGKFIELGLSENLVVRIESEVNLPLNLSLLSTLIQKRWPRSGFNWSDRKKNRVPS
jgi:hypothetical protein